MTWTDIGHIDDIPLRGARVIRTRLGDFGLFRTDPAEVFAVSNRCPHDGGPLSEGIVHGNKITCPLHNCLFDLATGAGLGPDGGQLETLRVQLDGGRILIDLASLDKKSAA